MPTTRLRLEAWRGEDDGVPLRLRHSRSPLPTIELDLDSLHSVGFHAGFGFVTHPLASFAAKHESLVATIYTYEGFSGNFRPPHNAVWFGVSGKKMWDILTIIEHSLKTRGARAKPAEHIHFEKDWSVFHIEDGRVWQKYDGEGRWYTDEDGDERLDDVNQTSEEDIRELDSRLTNAEIRQMMHAAPEEDVHDLDSGATMSAKGEGPHRRRVRGDARVGTMIQRIENEYGLPEGSVVLQYPDKRRVRADARIDTLRRQWEKIGDTQRREMEDCSWPPLSRLNFYRNPPELIFSSEDRTLDLADNLMRWVDNAEIYFGLITFSHLWENWTEENVQKVEELIKYDLEFDGYNVVIQRITNASDQEGIHRPCRSEFLWKLNISGSL